jgi:hypothetical protein
MLADEFKSISHYLTDNCQAATAKNLLVMSKMTSSQFRKYYELFYSFSKEKALDLSQDDILIHRYLTEICSRYGKKRRLMHDAEFEAIYQYHFRIITKIINSLTELRVEMEF